MEPGGEPRAGVCRAVAALRNAKKRDRTRSPQTLDALYRPRIEAEQAKRTQAGLRPGGRLARDRAHARRGRGVRESQDVLPALAGVGLIGTPASTGSVSAPAAR